MTGFRAVARWGHSLRWVVVIAVLVAFVPFFETLARVALRHPYAGHVLFVPPLAAALLCLERRRYDRLTARGSTFRNGAAVVFRDRREPDEITTTVSQLFLGVRLECAKCHHHPFEVWGQDDFYSLAAYFARLGHKVMRLKRIAIGPVKLDRLPKGKARRLKPEELARLRRLTAKGSRRGQPQS